MTVSSGGSVPRMLFCFPTILGRKMRWRRMWWMMLRWMMLILRWRIVIAGGRRRRLRRLMWWMLWMLRMRWMRWMGHILRLSRVRLRWRTLVMIHHVRRFRTSMVIGR